MLGLAAAEAKSLEFPMLISGFLYIEMLNSMTGCRYYLQFRALVESTWVSAGPSVPPGSLKIASIVGGRSARGQLDSRAVWLREKKKKQKKKRHEAGIVFEPI